jgi:transcriptional regulator with XRE-family HTH domain
MTSRDIVRIARQRAGITQRQLADRSGHPRETIARWETGAREPSLATLEALVAACDLDLVVHLAQKDSSLSELVADQLALTATERLGRLMPATAKDDTLHALSWLAEARTPAIVIGGVAAVLQGGPQQPGDGHVHFVSGDPYAAEVEMRNAGLIPSDTDERWADVDRRAPWALPDGGTIALASNVPGTRDYPDLRRSARIVQLDDGTSVAVAHPRDLLRMADASPRESERARVPGLRALLSQLADPADHS